jgi:acetyltransferase-like isoleucine patch superfamily enzyme
MDNVIISNIDASANLQLGYGVIIKENVTIGDNVKIGNFSIIYPDTIIEDDCEIQDRVILGHPAIRPVERPAILGKGSVVHSGAIIFAGTQIGAGSRFGNNSVVREMNTIGKAFRFGMLAQMENNSVIGDRVIVVAGAHVTAYAKIEEDVFIGGHVIMTNDKQMDRGDIQLVGPTIHRGARIGSNALLLPGVEIGEEAVVGGGAVVAKDVPDRTLVLGVPAKPVKSVPDELQRYKKDE